MSVLGCGMDATPARSLWVLSLFTGFESYVERRRLCPVRILAVNAARETRWEKGLYEALHRWSCPALAGQDEWRRLGWLMADNSLPFGELDAIAPELAQFNYLPGPNSVPKPIVLSPWDS